jgi:hypothetical protein
MIVDIWNLRLGYHGVKKIVELEVVIAVIVKTAIFWDITPCNRLRVN